MKPRKSTAILMAAWLSTFVVYVLVKPVEKVDTPPTTLLNTVPAWVDPTR
ncbi:hypothetical protein [Nocardia sp. AG03]|nr:hypothetical protein [Nocardia sp. AG03]